MLFAVGFVDQVFVWNSANLHSQLPIAVGGGAIFTAYCLRYLL